MRLHSFFLSFSVTLAFVPLDHWALVSKSKRSSSNNNSSSSTYHRFKVSPASNSSAVSYSSISRPLVRSKRTIHKLDKWESILNQFDRKPKSRWKTRFYLYTRQNPKKGQELCIDDRPTLMHSHFDPNKRVIFLISGWLDNRFFAKWVREAVRHLLNRGDFNVIYVAWRSIKELFVAAILIKLYSEELAEFIEFLKQTHSISGHSIHCIGHSLGGFICGFAGDVTHIGRISVLDAGPRPYYEKMHFKKRINRFQADFVDVIHSDFNPKFSLGLTIPVGDLDFFPNAGSIQDGCWRDKWHKAYQEMRDEGPLVSLDQMARYAMFCSHYRAHEWFFESVWNEQCQFVGVLCPSYAMFRRGECSCEDIWSGGHAQTTCALMGYDAEYAVMQQGLTKYSPQGKWYLKTSDFTPKSGYHCEYQYQLVVKLGQMSPAVQNGTFLVTFVARSNAYRSVVKVVAHELMEAPLHGLHSHYQVNKLVLRAHSLPLSQLTAIYLSYQTSEPEQLPLKLHPGWSSFVSIPWVKLSPIHVLNSEPIYFCHLQHILQMGRTNMLKRCDST